MTEEKATEVTTLVDTDSFVLNDGKVYRKCEHPLFSAYKPMFTATEKPTLNWKGGKFNPNDWDQALAFLLWTQAEFKSESLMNIYHDENNQRLYALPVPQFVSKGKTVNADPNNEELWAKHWAMTRGDDVVGTIHHHCTAGAFQSTTDANDEKNKFGLHITIGNLDRPNNLAFHGRTCFNGIFYAPILGEWFDMLNPAVTRYSHHQFYNDLVLANITSFNGSEFPEEWKEFCQKKQYNYAPAWGSQANGLNGNANGTVSTQASGQYSAFRITADGLVLTRWNTTYNRREYYNAVNGFWSADLEGKYPYEKDGTHVTEQGANFIIEGLNYGPKDKTPLELHNMYMNPKPITTTSYDLVEAQLNDMRTFKLFNKDTYVKDFYAVIEEQGLKNAESVLGMYSGMCLEDLVIKPSFNKSVSLWIEKILCPFIERLVDDIGSFEAAMSLTFESKKLADSWLSTDMFAFEGIAREVLRDLDSAAVDIGLLEDFQPMEGGSYNEEIILAALPVYKEFQITCISVLELLFAMRYYFYNSFIEMKPDPGKSLRAADYNILRERNLNALVAAFDYASSCIETVIKACNVEIREAGEDGAIPEVYFRGNKSGLDVYVDAMHAYTGFSDYSESSDPSDPDVPFAHVIH